MNNEEQQLIQRLRSLNTIRFQAQRLLQLAKNNQLQHFMIHPQRLETTVAFVVEVMQERYPDANIPYHSRWRHFEAGDVSRVMQLRQSYSPNQLIELVIISVFLDAGAGARWHYVDKTTGLRYQRSEGLALASLLLYQRGMLSSDPKEPLRVDAKRLIAFNEEDMSSAFQITSANPLEGLSGRVALLNRLGMVIQDNPQFFGARGCLGDFYSYLLTLNTSSGLSVSSLFQAVLDAFNDIWPVRLQIHGVSLGDVGVHPALKNEQPGSEYLPFHKLSQWLTYSLIEPLEWSGATLTDLDALTALPEYRNGGLLLDSQLIEIKNKNMLTEAYEPQHEVIVEWRALTIALIDELAPLIRKNIQQHNLPLAKILQGGTWEAGRRMAYSKRKSGVPPIQIISDGTIF